jgi:XTP/dITP diphosphohydrolase
MPTILIATRNRHKTGEIAALLPAGFTVLSLADISGSPTVDEDAPTFAGNAEKKASTLTRFILSAGIPLPGPLPLLVLADDSGLEVDHLQGAPGVQSARFAALDTPGTGNSSDSENNAKLLRLLAGVPREKRTGRFRCVLAVQVISTYGGSSPCRFFEGACEGHLEKSPRGRGGFGYDPLFIPEGHTASFAELGETTKNRISHRARALAGFTVWLAREFPSG